MVAIYRKHYFVLRGIYSVFIFLILSLIQATAFFLSFCKQGYDSIPREIKDQKAEEVCTVKSGWSLLSDLHFSTSLKFLGTHWFVIVLLSSLSLSFLLLLA